MSVANSYKPIALPPISAILREVEVHEKLNSLSTAASATNKLKLTPSLNSYNYSSNNNSNTITPTNTNNTTPLMPPVLLPSIPQKSESSYSTDQSLYHLKQGYSSIPSSIGDSTSLSRSTSFSSQSSLLSYHPSSSASSTSSASHDHSLTSNTPSSRDSTPSISMATIPLEQIITLTPTEHDSTVEQLIIKDSRNPRKYKCKTCEKFFTTSGHLARHSRIHTGERKHVCPHPDCNARFARHDNCMQHYRTHKNPKTRKRRQPRP